MGRDPETLLAPSIRCEAGRVTCFQNGERQHALCRSKIFAGSSADAFPKGPFRRPFCCSLAPHNAALSSPLKTALSRTMQPTLAPASSAPSPFCTRCATPPRYVSSERMPPPKRKRPATDPTIGHRRTPKKCQGFHEPSTKRMKAPFAPNGQEFHRARCARIITTLNRRRACRFEVCFQIRLTGLSSHPSLARLITTGPCGCPSEATPRAAVVSGLSQ